MGASDLDVRKRADVILIDMQKPHLKPLHGIRANLVYSARRSDVDTTIVDGEILMEHRKVKFLDEQKVMEKVEKTAFDLLSRQFVSETSN